MYFLTTSVKGVEMPARKSTGFLPNTWRMTSEHNIRLDKVREYWSLMVGRAKETVAHPNKLYKIVC